MSAFSLAASWKEKPFYQLSDTEIEATLNLSKRVFDEVLGRNLPKYYQTESLSVPKRSGLFDGRPENMVRLSRPIIALSVAYPEGDIGAAGIAKIEKAAKAKAITWKGVELSITECIVEVSPRGAGEYHDKITIYPLRVRVRSGT
jgi:hypothetical protein